MDSAAVDAVAKLTPIDRFAAPAIQSRVVKEVV